MGTEILRDVPLICYILVPVLHLVDVVTVASACPMLQCMQGWELNWKLATIVVKGEHRDRADELWTV